MPTITVSAPTADAIAAQVSIETANYDSVTVSAPGLATTEEVDIFTGTPGGWAIYAGAGGAAVKLTASLQAVTLPGGPRYGFLKDSTAGAVGIYASFSRGST
jgi:hypothetical protein